uniref:Uncharacterized protein n=1 Tax=Anopheles darlingi TaxID=43151 RepID=A0A2M4DAD0_ANODA
MTALRRLISRSRIPGIFSVATLFPPCYGMCTTHGFFFVFVCADYTADRRKLCSRFALSLFHRKTPHNTLGAGWRLGTNVVQGVPPINGENPLLG